MSHRAPSLGPVLSRRGLIAAATVTAAAATLVSAVATEDSVKMSRMPRLKQGLVMPPFLPVDEQSAQGGPIIV